MRLFVVALLLVASAACGPKRDEGDVKRFVATLTVSPDGAVDVVERIRVDVAPGAGNFRRRADLWRHDAVVNVNAELDGNDVRLAATYGEGLDAVWPLEAVKPGPHDFTLRYRLVGAVEISGIRGTLAWRFENLYSDIADVRLRIVLPVGAILLEEPWVDEAGFDVARLDNGMTARGAVAAKGTATPGLTFTIDTMTPSLPKWQYFRGRAKDLVPAFVAGGLFILVIGAGAVGMVRLKYRPHRPHGSSGDDLKLTPEMEAALRRGNYTPGHEQLLAAGLVDVERMFVARDLGRAASASFAVGLIGWFVARRYFWYLDVWPQAIPVSVVLCAAMFWYESRRMSILSERGVRARALLYSARNRDAQTTA